MRKGGWRVKKQKAKRVHILVMLLALVVLATGVVLLYRVRKGNTIHTEVHVSYKPMNVYDKTLVVAADRDYDPYSFYDEDHVPSGHDVELAYILANRMGYNVDLRLLPWLDAVDTVEAHSADMVLTLAYAPQEYPNLALSIPLVNDPFVAFGQVPFEEIGELYKRRLAVVEGTGCVSGFIHPYRLTGQTTLYSSVSAAFEALRKGDCDYAILRYSVGRRAMAELGDSCIQAVGPTLLNNYVCIGVPKEHTALLEELNTAIIGISADGTLAELSEKWLGHYVNTLTLGEYLEENLETLLYVVGGLALLFLTGFLLISRAISHKKETVLKKLAERDQLTGLYNRATCEGIIRETINSSDPTNDVHALLVIDMDNFKAINDSFGHMEGDAALIRLSAGLSRLFRSGDVVGRLGGDEFFVFMTSCAGMPVAAQKARLINSLFANTYQLDGVTRRISASVGIAAYPLQGQDFDALYRQADQALYEAKRLGKGGYAFWEADGTLHYEPCGETAPLAEG